MVLVESFQALFFRGNIISIARVETTQEQLARNSGFGRVLLRRFSFEEISKFVAIVLSAHPIGQNKTSGVLGSR